MALDESNPFAAPSSLPFAFPPFDAVRHEHYRPAFDAGVAEHRAEIAAITGNPDEPTFANTDRGARAQRAAARPDDAGLLRARQLDGDAADAGARGRADARAVGAPGRDTARPGPVRPRGRGPPPPAATLTEEQRRLVERHHTDFVRAGAALAAEQQERLRAAQRRDLQGHHRLRTHPAGRDQRQRRARDRPGPRSTGSPTTPSRRPPSRPRRPTGGLPAHAVVPDDPAGDLLAARPRRSAGGCTRPPRRAACGAATTTPRDAGHPDRRAAGRAGRAARLRRPRRPTSSTTRPPAPPRR